VSSSFPFPCSLRKPLWRSIGPVPAGGARRDMVRLLCQSLCLAVGLATWGCGASTVEQRTPTSAGKLTEGPERFVDPHHTLASDDNPGTEAEPWLTLAKAGTAAKPGETVWVRSGVYTEGLDVQVSGAPGHRITFAPYPGDAVVLRNNGIEVRGQSHVEIRGFRIEECTGGVWDERGIVVRGISKGPVVRDIVIANNHIYHTYSSAISIWGVTWGQDPGNFRCLIDVVVEHNTIERANDGGYNEQITVANGVEDFEIRYNVIRNGGVGTNGGEGIDIKEGCAFGSIHHNVVHDIQRRAFYIDGGGRDPNYKNATHDIDVYANVAYNVVNGLAIMSEGGQDVYNVRVWNNVFYNIGNDCAFVFDHPNAAANPGRFWSIEFTNNTFWDCGRTGLDLNSTQLAGAILVRNNILKSYLDRNGLATATHNLIGENPVFVDETTDDFHLLPLSPAIDAGTHEGAPSDDLDGAQRPHGGFDIGAYEFVR